jgi:hypothetical protein
VLRDLRRALPRRAVVCDDSSATAATATDATAATNAAASKGRHRGNATAWALFMRQITQMVSRTLLHIIVLLALAAAITPKLDRFN